MKFMEKLLSKSNSYVYYKNNYNKLLNSQNKLKEDNKFLKKYLKHNKVEIIKLQKRLGNYSKPKILDKILNEQYSELTIAIKSPNPKGHHHWGDYFFSIALKNSFKKLGFNVIIQEHEDWYNGVKADINIVLRGVEKYEPNFDEINIMWNISHPDMVKKEEYELYDICFISSEKYAIKINNEVNTIVKPLLQCTDPEVFNYSPKNNLKEDILFVGVTRGVYREIIKDVMQTDFDVSIYGMGWEEFIDKKYIKGQFIPNEELYKYYSSCKILLNDHWEDMREWDFPSNRLFDALACGTFVISDKISSAETLFEGNIVTYDDVNDLNNKIIYYLTHEDERKEKAQKGREIVLNNHTFDNRVDTIIDSLKNLKLNNDMKLEEYHFSFDVKSILNQLNQKISIIIPIYNAYDDLIKCLESIFKYTQGNYELILINDNSSDYRIEHLLNEYNKKNNVKIIKNEFNKGFVENVNIGLKISQNDVILLNSDTIVTPKWLQKLIFCAYSKKDIGTVTPVANNSGAFSVPVTGINNVIPVELGINGMANIIEKSSKRVFMEVPTGNGFCMYIKRDVINEVGLFDVENFGKGYCEENDYCMRAIQKGWCNVIDDSTYIFHKGSASFSDEKEQLIKKHRKILDMKHPTYTNRVQNFLSSKELKSITSNVAKNLENFDNNGLNKKNLLFLLHGGGGGTFYHTNDLLNYFEKLYNCYLLISNKKEIILYKFFNHEKILIKKWKLKSKWVAENFYIEEFAQIYLYILIYFSIDLVHIQHLIHHTFDLPKICKQLNIPVILSLHDFYFICLSHNLINGDEKYCNGKCVQSIRCCDHMDLSELNIINSFVDEWRENVEDLFCNVDLLITPSKVSKDIYLENYPIIHEKIKVISHGRDIFKINDDLFEFPSLSNPVKILFIGNTYLQKGSNIIKKLHDIDKKKRLEFHFLGDTAPELKDIGIHHGTYNRNDLIEHVSKIKPSFIGIFSIWPETFCYTLSEAWMCKIPVIVSNIGILKERLLMNDGGWLIDYENMQETYELILRIANNPHEYQLKINNINSFNFKSIKSMCNEYQMHYNKLLMEKFNIDS